MVCSELTASPGSKYEPGEPACVQVDRVELVTGVDISELLTVEQHRDLQEEAHEMWRDGGSKL